MAGSKKNWKAKALKVLDGLRHGPVSDEIIKDNNRHVSHEVWAGNDRGVLEIIGGGRSRWWVVTEEMRDILAFCGFGVFGNPDVVIQNDAALISALVERWRPECNSFMLRPGEMTITLEDVGMILGLPLAGEAVTCSVFPDKRVYFNNNWFEPLSLEEQRRGWIRGGISLRWLFEICGSVEPPRERDMIHAKAYILYILGSVLFPTTSKNCVHPRLLMLLQDVYMIPGYAWGAAVLAYLYRGLGAASMFRCKKFAACLLVLQIWAYERLLPGRPRRRGGSEMLFPTAEGWTYCSWREVDVDRRADGPHHDISFYRGELDGDAGDVVEWRPYERFVDSDVTYANSFADFAYNMGLGEVPLIFFDVVEYQFPERVMRQFGFPPHIPPPPMDMSQFRRGIDNTFRKTNLRTKWFQEIRMWVRFCEEFVGRVTDDGGVSEEEYLQWYARVSFFRVGKPQGQIEAAMGFVQSLDEQIEPGMSPAFANLLPTFLEPYTEFVQKLHGPAYVPPSFGQAPTVQEPSGHEPIIPEPAPYFQPEAAPYSQHEMDITQSFTDLLTSDPPLVQPEKPVFDEGEGSHPQKLGVTRPASKEKLAPSKLLG